MDDNIRVYAYGRVSTKEQNEGVQVDIFEELNINPHDIYIDKMSGKDFNRTEYIRLKHSLRPRDILYIKNIDRLGRNYKEILDEWREITKNLKADIRVIDFPLLDTTLHKDLLGTFISDLILQVLSFTAEQEFKNIKKRQSQGIERALKNGVKFGRPEVEVPINFKEVIKDWQNKKIKAVEAMKILNLKKSTFYKLVKENRYK